MLNICYCGVESGYPHLSDCPYPLYRADAEREAKWFEARKAKIAERTKGGPEKFVRIVDWYAAHAGHTRPPIVKCPEYWECGDYADWARAGHKPGKVAVRCAYHARKIEQKEAAARATEVRP